MSRYVLAVFILVVNVKLADGEEAIKAMALRPGDTVMFVAPARGVDKTKTLLAKQRLEEMGFRVLLHKHLFERVGYLAGTDAQRSKQIMDAFRDERVSAVLPVTGGFGTTRLLDLLDYKVIRQNPKVLIGYSDITGLHLAIQKKAGLITFHGPNLDSGLGVPNNLTAFSKHWFQRAIIADHYSDKSLGYLISHLPNNLTAEQYDSMCKLQPPTSFGAGKASGVLTGGNLSLVAALMGTPYEIETKNRILFLEDIGEAPYRVDRMLSTLRLGGKLKDLSGVILGTFTYRSDQDTSIEEGQSVDDVLASYFKPLGIPVIRGFPAGHHRCNATLPIGARCEIDADAGTIRLLESPIR